MDMKKRILLSMILLALCLIQASADTYYFKILLTNENGQPGEWSDYIKVDAVPDGVDVNGQPKYKYPNGLGTLLNGGTVKNEEGNKEYTLPKKDDKVDLDKIWGIEFANGKGRYNNAQENIMEGDEYEAWKGIRERIKYLRLRYYIRDTYNDKSYLADMFNVEELELPKYGMTVENKDEDGQYYFASAHNLKKITIHIDGYKDPVDITDNAVNEKKLLNRVGKFMFANCWALSPKYINRLIKNVEEIKDNAFFADDKYRDNFSYETDNKVIEIPSSVKIIGKQAFLNRVKDTGLNIQGNGSLDIGFEAFKACDELAKIQTLDNRVLRISENAFMCCKQLNDFENMDKAKITYLGTGVFRNCRSMTSEFVNGVLQNYANNGGTTIPAFLFSGCNGQEGYASSFTQLDIPASFTQIDRGAFADNPKVTKIIVHRDEQINAQSYGGEEGIFYKMVPNKVQVVFEGKADNNYKVYRENIKVGGEDKGPNAFMFLLTKTLNENDDDYQVVAQRHADVRLTRTFKAGWNTLVLPFGARHGEGREDGAGDCARIFQKALNASDTPGFMIAVYRGLAKNDAQPDNSTFYFLQYTGYDENPIDEFEPLLIRMTQKDIDNANANEGVYTFKDVELNYDGDNNRLYTADEVKARMGKKEDGEYFDGSYDHEANDKFRKCTYNDFYFTGTLYKQQGTASQNSAFIAPGDYIIQNNTFVKCLADRKYGFKGFRGYFKQKPSSTPSAKGNIGISLVDRNGVVSSIHQVDGTSLTPASVAPAAVYNLSGQKVGNSLSTLAKGVYIVNGKKFVKK